MGRKRLRSPQTLAIVLDPAIAGSRGLLVATRAWHSRAEPDPNGPILSRNRMGFGGERDVFSPCLHGGNHLKVVRKGRGEKKTRNFPFFEPGFAPGMRWTL